jgi:hypothetical protein
VEDYDILSTPKTKSARPATAMSRPKTPPKPKRHQAKAKVDPVDKVTPEFECTWNQNEPAGVTSKSFVDLLCLFKRYSASTPGPMKITASPLNFTSIS